MPYSVTPSAGIDVTQVFPATTYGTSASLLKAPFALGHQVWGNDGKLYVFAQANASISASTAVCTVNASTFLATASGGSYLSPATALVTGDYAWFSKASV